MKKFNFEDLIVGLVTRIVETAGIWAIFNFMIAPSFSLPYLSFIGSMGIVFIFKTLK